MRAFLTISAAALALASTAVRAEVHDTSASGFAVRATAVVPASAQNAWDELLDPAEWWSGNHTFSGDAANLSLDPRAGGCFCEVLPSTSAGAPPRGGVQHMQVVYLEAPKTLRLSGALGPLQSEPVSGVLTFIIRPDGAGTRINAEYAVGGYMRIPAERMGPLVDKVITEQLGRLAKKLGGGVETRLAPTSASATPSPAQKPRSSTPQSPTIESKPIIGR